MMKHKINMPKSVQEQEKWRQKQIKIFYTTGRPIFKDWKEKLEPSACRFDNIEKKTQLEKELMTNRGVGYHLLIEATNRERVLLRTIDEQEVEIRRLRKKKEPSGNF